MEATSIPSLLELVDVTEASTVSRTVVQDDRVKVVLFAFAAGQELSEHTASVPAILHVLDGTAHVTLADQAIDAGPQTWVHMPAHLPHSIRAVTDVRMLLTLLRAPGA
ncbi:MAG: cupin domain-containing protein [Myxococcota bacterium]